MYSSNEILEDNDVFFQFSPIFNHLEDSLFNFLPPPTSPQQLMETLNNSSRTNNVADTMIHKAFSSNIVNVGGCGKKTTGLPKRRSGKKDRHSKIVTAHGTRDRRMRLSVEISRNFFDLQDMLGFDKASKTVEWLMKQSEQAIGELRKDSNTGDVVSEIDEGKKGFSSRKSLDVSKKTSCKTIFARDLRVKARARARERTLEKKKRRLDKPKQCAVQEMNQLKPLSLFESGDDDSRGSRGNIMNFSLEEPGSHSPKHQGPNKDVASNYFVINTVSSPSSGFSYQNNFENKSNTTTTNNNNVPNFAESWGTNVDKMQLSYYGNLSIGDLQYPVSSSIFMNTADDRLLPRLMDINQFYAKSWESKSDLNQQ